MLVVSSIARHESDLRKCIFEANLFRNSRIFDIRVQVSFSALRYLRDDQPARHIRYPVAGECQWESGLGSS